MNLKNICLLLLLCCTQWLCAENGYELWLRYQPVSEGNLCDSYRLKNRKVMFPGEAESLVAARKELQAGLSGLLDRPYTEVATLEDDVLVVGTPQSVPLFREQAFYAEINGLSDEGYLIQSRTIEGKKVTVLSARTDIGVLYGVFHYLRLMQTSQPLDKLAIKENPKLKYRVLNHWDNLNGTVERGYAGYSIWNWERLPSYKEQRYTDYARANASIGINGAVLNNVNAQAKSLRTDWLVKASGLADVFRPYGIKVYLTAKFSAPKEIGGLATADPKDPRVREWWKDKVKEIYTLIPDFGGFLVKANSEGQPGPQDYGCSHADGANMLGEALEPYGGIVFWRAFVYQNERHVDRVINGYNEFKPLDGQFGKNVFVQPKNGAIDFQPREPFHPLFGGMPGTPLSLEFQITQENLGHAGHLVYLGTLFEETLQSDTYENGKGSTVSKALQNYQKSHGISAIAGVPNIGTDLNWTGHLFGQANWYAFGRLAWDPDLSSAKIAEDWARMTFSNDEGVLTPVLKIMLMSRETYVDYTMPLGLNHIMNYDTHNGPEPWHDDPVWTAFDYHKVTKDSIGVNRTAGGTGATRQYHSPLYEKFDDIRTCPQEYLLWFHRVPWNYKMASGKTLWNELIYHYYKGVDEVRQMQTIWNGLEGKIDRERFDHVASLLKYQEREAIWWRDGCLLFFQEYSRLPIPANLEQPEHSLKYYQTIPFPHNWKGLAPAQARQRDEYWTSPRGTYEERRALFLDYYSENGSVHPLYGVFRQAARAASGRPLEMDKMREVISTIKSNRDCNDFTLNCLLRMVYLDRKQPFFPEEIKGNIEECILDFKYWWDDGRRDTTYRCYHTENHQALYHTAELLAGQLYKKTKFTNGMNGRQHMAHAKERLMKWLEYRFRFGFSEWMSTYYEVEVLLLANLYDFAEDKDIRSKAGMVLDLLLFDVALNNYEGFLGSASGRNYAHSIIMGAHNTAPLAKLVFGVGTYDRDEVIAPVALSTSSYRCPEVIRKIAVDYKTPILNRQRVSINVEDAPVYGISYENELDCHLFWGMQEFIHPMAVRMSRQISEKYDVWPYRNYDEYIKKYDAQMAEHGKLVDMHLDRFALSEANIETYRTPDYMLSCALDYRKGAPGYQQHIWQATLGNKALVYTNHPGGKNLRWSPNYWAGNEILPRAAQNKNVVICLYNIPANQKNDFSHAYFPVRAFDEVRLSGSWIFGRKDDGYVALYSRNAAELRADDRGEICDFLAKGRQNIWICETGSKSQWGSFSKFIEAVSAAPVRNDGLDVTYESPSEGMVSYSWDGAFYVKGKEMPMRWEYRYDNPYCKAPFNSTRIAIEKDGEKITLDYNQTKR